MNGLLVEYCFNIYLKVGYFIILQYTCKFIIIISHLRECIQITFPQPVIDYCFNIHVFCFVLRKQVFTNKRRDLAGH